MYYMEIRPSVKPKRAAIAEFLGIASGEAMSQAICLDQYGLDGVI